MRITQEKLKDILASHSKWLRGEYGGEKADLSNVDLSFTDLRCAELRCADLSFTDLRCANLSGAKLSGAKLSGANLSGANLRGANLSKTYYQIVRIGSREATTTYCVEDDKVVCGCWNNYKGGTLAEFKKTCRKCIQRRRQNA